MYGMEWTPVRPHRLRWVVILAAIVLSLAVPGLNAAQAQGGATILVNSFTDDKANDGVCTLREAVISANKDNSSGDAGECAAGSGDDTILLPPGTYTLTRSNSGGENASTTGDLDIDSNVTIQSAGPGLS